MTESSNRRRRRAAGALALLHAAYVVLAVAGVASVVTDVARDADSEPWLGLFLMAMVIPLLIGLAIASPLLTWFIVLGVALWRGRRWARTAGIVTFGVVGAALAITGFSGGQEVWAKLLGMVLFAGPTIAALVLLVTSPEAFPPAVVVPVEPDEIT